jgi:hypothetical protein
MNVFRPPTEDEEDESFPTWSRSRRNPKAVIPRHKLKDCKTSQDLRDFYDRPKGE